MSRIESSIVVSKSMEQTFSFLDAASNHGRFIPNMIEFNQTSAGAFGRVGATAHGVLKMLGVRMDVPYEIIEHEPNARLAMKGLLGPIQFRDGYVLSPADAGTRINFWLELTFRGVAAAARPFGALIGKIHAHETLNNLKRELEAAQ